MFRSVSVGFRRWTLEAGVFFERAKTAYRYPAAEWRFESPCSGLPSIHRALRKRKPELTDDLNPARIFAK
jgi:hypothetical protein